MRGEDRLEREGAKGVEQRELELRMEMRFGLLDKDQLARGTAGRSTLAEILDEDRDVEDVVEAKPVAARLKALHCAAAE